MTSVALITPDNFQEKVVMEPRPVLILCMPCDERFPLQLKVIEALSQRCVEKLKVAWVKESFLEIFKRNFKIYGTPTFLMLLGGKEKKRMIGIADLETLSDFISFHEEDEDSSYGVTVVKPKSKLIKQPNLKQNDRPATEGKGTDAAPFPNSTYIR